MADVTTEEAPPQDVTATPASPPGLSPADPFALDEAQLASLSPEQRASLDPILEGWRAKAKAEIETTRKTVSEESSKPFREKSEALDQLVKHPAFIQWWNQQQAVAKQGLNAQGRAAVDATKPQDFATPEEWSQAVIDASNGNPQKIQEINARMLQMMAAPYVQQTNARMQELNTKLEMKDLMESHPDYKDLDQIGLDEKGEGTSLLEFCINWAEQNRRPLEDGYQMAKRWANGMDSKAKAGAMGLLKDKRESSIASPSSSSSGGNVVYVKDTDELIRRSMEAELSGNKNVRFEIKS